MNILRTTSKPCAFGSCVTDRKLIPNKNNLVLECWISTPSAPPSQMMSELSDFNIQKADVNIFLNQKFARQTEMMHINFLNLGVAD